MPVETPPTPNKTTPPPPRLDYAQAQSIVSRIGLRRVIWLSVLSAFVVAAIVWWDPAWGRVQRWRVERAYRQLQQECMTYAAPADRVVYEEDPAEAAALQKLPTYAPILQLDTATMTQIVRPGWRPPVQFTEPLWTKYSAGIRPLPTTPQAVAFMGERRTKSGERRLVCVGIAVQAQRSADGRWSIVRWLQAWSFARGSLDSADQTVPMGQMLIDSDAKRPPGESDPLRDDPNHPFTPPFPLRLYAGQPDPADGSRFTIDYALQGRRGAISGVLQDDGSVLLTPDIGWHGRLGTTVSWTPKISGQNNPPPATTRSMN